MLLPVYLTGEQNWAFASIDQWSVGIRYWDSMADMMAVIAQIVFFFISLGCFLGSLPSCKIDEVGAEKIVDSPSSEALEKALGFMKKAYDVMKQQALDVMHGSILPVTNPPPRATPGTGPAL